MIAKDMFKWQTVHCFDPKIDERIARKRQEEPSSCILMALGT